MPVMRLFAPKSIIYGTISEGIITWLYKVECGTRRVGVKMRQETLSLWISWEKRNSVVVVSLGGFSTVSDKLSWTLVVSRFPLLPLVGHPCNFQRVVFHKNHNANHPSPCLGSLVRPN